MYVMGGFMFGGFLLVFLLLFFLFFGIFWGYNGLRLMEGFVGNVLRLNKEVFEVSGG